MGSPATTLDLAIRGGTVATAADTMRCDVGIRDGRIVALGEDVGPADHTIDAAGLLVHPYTFRRENSFTPCELDSSTDPAGIGDLVSEIRQFIRLGVDGFFTDNADYGVRARS